MKFMKIYSIYKFFILFLLKAPNKVKIMRSDVDLKFLARNLRKIIWINPNIKNCESKLWGFKEPSMKAFQAFRVGMRVICHIHLIPQRLLKGQILLIWTHCLISKK